MTDPSPGAALRYLRDVHQPSLQPPRPLPARLPPLYKRYPRGCRRVLPHAPSPHGDPLGWLLRQVNGVTRVRWLPGSPLVPPPSGGDRVSPVTLVSPGRPVPSSGARYPIEVYAATGPGTRTAPGLPAGLYHYDPAHHVLDELRTGDGRDRITACLDSRAATPDLVLLFTDVFWRNAAKYRDFGYRLQSLDTGFLVGQTVALAATAGYTARVHLRFADEALDTLLGLTPGAESVFAVVCLNRRGDATLPVAAGGPAPGVDWSRPVPADLAPAPSLADIGELPALATLHAAVRSRAAGVDAWRDPEPPGAGPAIALPADPLDLSGGVARRRTVGAFCPGQVDTATIGRLLRSAVPDSTVDVGEGRVGCGATLLCCVPTGVRGLAPDAYRYEPTTAALVPTGGAQAGQALPAAARSPMLAEEFRTAHATVVPVGNFTHGIAAYGDRWYRMQNIEAGMLAQHVCLAAAALGLDSHVHCDFSIDLLATALGLAGSPWQPLVVVTVGTRRPDRVEPQTPLRR